MFDLSDYVEARRALIDRALDSALPPEDARPSIIHRAMRYGVFSGGKRLRPILCLAAAEAAGGSAAVAILPAAAIELLHTYTLIHDDLPSMDNDDTRRGKPTCHVVFGEANAVLAGDALQALAFEVLARAAVPPPYSPSQLILELAHAAGSLGVVGGQVEDLAPGESPEATTIEFIHRHKTADLFRAAVRLGGIAGAADPVTLSALTDYGVALGLAFQLVDDLLDAAPDAAKAKPSHERARGVTALSVQSRESARQQADQLVTQAIEALQRLGAARIAPLQAIAQFCAARTA